MLSVITLLARYLCKIYFYTYQLLQIPVTDWHVSLVLIHAVCEALNLETTVWLSKLVLLLGLGWHCVILSCFWCAGSTTEESRDGMAYRGADSNTSVEMSLICDQANDMRQGNSRCSAGNLSKETSARALGLWSTCLCLRSCWGSCWPWWVCGSSCWSGLLSWWRRSVRGIDCWSRWGASPSGSSLTRHI